MVDAHDSGSCEETLRGSSPLSDIIKQMMTSVIVCFILTVRDAEPHRTKFGLGSSGSERKAKAFSQKNNNFYFEKNRRPANRERPRQSPLGHLIF